MPVEQYTYWSVTINNPDDNDYLIIRNPNSKYIREMVWTPEVGEEGTKHIQGWVRFQRNQGMGFVKKLYPRAHLKPCSKDDYAENCHNYAQKDDETTAGPHHISLFDPLPANDTLLYKVLDRAFERLVERDMFIREEYTQSGERIFINGYNGIHLKMLDTPFVEQQMVMEKSGLEKIFCSPAYDKMKQTFWRQILFRIYKEKNAEQRSATTQETSSNEEGSEGEDIQDDNSQTSGGSTEGSDDEVDSEDY